MYVKFVLKSKVGVIVEEKNGKILLAPKRAVGVVKSRTRWFWYEETFILPQVEK